MNKFYALVLLLYSWSLCAATAPQPPLQLSVTPTAIYPSQPLVLSWTANSGHQAGVSDFGVYLLPATGGQQLMVGPQAWQSTRSTYQANLKAQASPSSYWYRVYTRNLSNYCSYTDITMQVLLPTARTAAVNLTLVNHLTLGQPATLSWNSGTGHIADQSAFGVYVTPPGGRERLLQGRINWLASQSLYRVLIKSAAGAGDHRYNVYGCNFSNYCHYADEILSVSSSSQTLYKVTATAGIGGLINPASTTVTSGNSASFTDTPNVGFMVDKVEGCGIAATGASYKTAAIYADCKVSAIFRALPVTQTRYLYTDITGSVIEESTGDVSVNTTKFYNPFGESKDN